MDKYLHLNVDREFFEEAAAGRKPFEFRKANKYWLRRLSGRNYKGIKYKLGYPAADDTSRILTFPWRGYECQTITHKKFGNVPENVFAIRLEM